MKSPAIPKQKSRNFCGLLVSLACGLMTTSSLSGQTTLLFDDNVDYGGGGNLSNEGTSEVVSGQFQTLYEFSDSTPLPLGGTWPEAFGGFLGQSDDTTATSFNFAHRGDNPNNLRFQTTGESPEGSTMNAIEYWELSSPVAFDSLELSMTQGFVDLSTTNMHFVVRADGDFYVSDMASNVSNDVFTLDATATDWQSWDFSANGGNNFSVAFDSTEAASSISVDAIGVYAFIDGNGVGNVQALGYEGTAIPEPSTYAMLFGASVFGFVVYRRQTGNSSQEVSSES